MNQRKMGLDIYRILLACMVVFIHMCNMSDGQALAGANQSNIITYSIVWIGLTIAYPAVNGYALLSGYLCYGKEHGIKKILNVWLQLLFYSVIITLIVGIINNDLSVVSIIKSFMPISFGQWWYINIYLLLIIIMPFIDKAVDAIPEKEFKYSIVIILAVIGLSNMLLQQKDIFYIYNGYSLSWLSLMYIVGAGIKKYKWNEKLKPSQWFWLWCISSIITLSSKYWYIVASKVFSLNIIGNVLYDYDSITVIASSVFSLMFFLSIQIKSNGTILSKISKGSFAAYIIHVHLLFEKYYFKGKFEEVSNSKYSFVIIIIDILFVLISALIDMVRVKLFKFIYIFVNNIKNRREKYVK